MKDTRSHINQIYPVMEVAFVVITDMLCGQNKWTDIKDFGEGNIGAVMPYRWLYSVEGSLSRLLLIATEAVSTVRKTIDTS